MFIKYVGTRPFLSTSCSGRVQYYFGPENDFTIKVVDPAHVNELMRSTQHRFEVIAEMPKKSVEAPKTVPVPKETASKEAPVKAKTKRKGKRGKK